MFRAKKLSEHITRIHLPGNVFSYLITGEEKAVVVDTGCGYGDQKAFVESLTELPYVIVLTHGHVDHAGGASQFETVYLNPRDNDLRDKHTQKAIRKGYLLSSMDSVDEALLQEPCTDTLPMQDGDVFDLGGVHVVVWDIFGHTPGSMAVYIAEEKTVILGDACNSMTYLQLDHSLPVKEYLENLKVFREKHYDEIEECLYSHPHNYGGKVILEEAVSCCEDVMNGDVGTKAARGMLAKPVDEQQHRADGKIFNMFYRTVE